MQAHNQYIASLSLAQVRGKEFKQVIKQVAAPHSAADILAAQPLLPQDTTCTDESDCGDATAQLANMPCLQRS